MTTVFVALGIFFLFLADWTAAGFGTVSNQQCKQVGFLPSWQQSQSCLFNWQEVPRNLYKAPQYINKTWPESSCCSWGSNPVRAGTEGYILAIAGSKAKRCRGLVQQPSLLTKPSTNPSPDCFQNSSRDAPLIPFHWCHQKLCRHGKVVQQVVSKHKSLCIW